MHALFSNLPTEPEGVAAMQLGTLGGLWVSMYRPIVDMGCITATFTHFCCVATELQVLCV